MGGQELIEALRKTADEEVRRIEREAEREAEGIRNDAARRKEDLAHLAEGRPSPEAEEYGRRVLREASIKARNICLEAEALLLERLYRVACGSLGALQGEHEADLFAAMAAELPRIAWQTVRVHPRDLDIAREHFPDAEIVSDEGITGGMDAATQDGAVRVVNTFEKRIERAWPGLLTELMTDVHQRIKDR